MRALVDTTIWSLALRRRSRSLSARERTLVAEWRRLVEAGLATIVGPIRQEVLSGIRRVEDFERLCDHLAGFDCLELRLDDYDQAARFHNTLRSKGVAGTSVDLLICAVANRYDLPVFTTDKDFARYVHYLSIRCHEV